MRTRVVEILRALTNWPLDGPVFFSRVSWWCRWLEEIWGYIGRRKDFLVGVDDGLRWWWRILVVN